MTPEELIAAFTHHTPSNQTVAKSHGQIREILLSATQQVLLLIKPNTREAAMFIGKMREAMMWGNSALAIHQ